MTKEELINFKRELDQKNELANNDNRSLGFGTTRMLNPEVDEQTERLISRFDNTLIDIVTNSIERGCELSELQIDFLLFFLMEKAKEEEFDNQYANIKDANFDNKYNFLKENTSNKYYYCRVTFKGSNYIKDMYNNYREDMAIEEFIDIDKFISLMHNLGYNLFLGDKELDNADDIIRFSATHSLGSTYLTTKIDFEKENTNFISEDDEFYDKTK